MELVVWFREKKDRRNKGRMYCGARQTSKHIIWTRVTTAHVRLMNIYIGNSYSYGTMTQDHCLHPRHFDVDEWRTLHRSRRHASTLFPVHHWCQNLDAHGHWSGGEIQ